MPTLEYERAFWQQGYRYVAGCDEVGRGCWAGPVVAGAVILPAWEAPLCGVLRAAGLRDSKQLTPQKREGLVPLICEVAVAWAVGEASPEEIDRLGIVPATRLAMRRALEQLAVSPQALLLDALALPEVALPQQAIVDGDDRSLTVAAASVLAKVYRDNLMVELDARFPGYGFARHKGYGTPQHREALAALGPSPLHRRTWAPVRQFGSAEEADR